MAHKKQLQLNALPRGKTLRESGVTLLLSLLVLASIMAVVLSFAAIVINEIRSSGELIKTGPAVTAAYAGAELGLYYAVRGVGNYSTNCSSPTTTQFSNGAALSSCLNYYLPNPENLTLQPNDEQDYYLYDPINQSGNPGYTNLQITLNSGQDATINFCSWSAVDCANAPDLSSAAISAGQTWSSGALNPSNSYQLIVFNGSKISNFTISDSNVSGNAGLPSGTTLILTTGSNGDVTRKIQTSLPQ